MKMRLVLLLLSLAVVSPAFGRLGDSEDQAIARYGIPKPDRVKNRTPVLENAREILFEYQGWHIRCAMLRATDGIEYVVREEYSKIWNPDVMKNGGSPTIQDFELEAILNAESNGKNWRKKRVGELDLSPVKMLENQAALAFSGMTFVRDDGATGIRPIGRTTVMLQLPAALRYEKELMAIKERKKRAAVPDF